MIWQCWAGAEWTKGKDFSLACWLASQAPCSRWGYPQNKYPLSLLGGRVGCGSFIPTYLFAHLHTLYLMIRFLFILHSLESGLCSQHMPSLLPHEHHPFKQLKGTWGLKARFTFRNLGLLRVPSPRPVLFFHSRHPPTPWAPSCLWQAPHHLQLP